MTIKECIDIVDNLKPNQYSVEDKVQWLSFIEGIIINDVLKMHEGYRGEYDDFLGYSADKLTQRLIVPAPYDRLYTAYITMKIDEANGEVARYNNSASLYNSYMMEYRKWYNKTHMPIGACRPLPHQPVKNQAVSDAQFEALKREVIAMLQEEFAKFVSKDKIHDVVVEYMNTNAAMFKGKDGRDGKDGVDGYTPRKGIDYFDGARGANGKDGVDGYTPQKGVDYFDGEDYVLTSADKNEIADKITATRIGEVELYASDWVGEGNLFSQIPIIEGVTEYSQVDLTPSVEQLSVFYEKDLTFVTENDNGVVTVYAIGQKPQNDYTIQVTITEVVYE